MKIRTRFAPSPTGNLHMGGGRTALFNALQATKHQGAFVLRIEDTDVARSNEEYVAMQQTDLHWLGIEWQEGPEVGGPKGPYWQSQRHDIYQRYYQQLEMQKQIYPCFCTDHELAITRKLQLSRGQPPRYAGTCRHLTSEAIEKQLAAGKNPAWRFIVPAGEVIQFNDLIKGTQSFKTDDIGDFIVRRADKTAPFLFCNAIDDALMEITQVLRGEDHLANTPRQLMIMKALCLPAPQYGHMSLIVGDDRTPLSKRHGSFGLIEMRKQGYLPLAIINYLARLGHGCDAPELLDFTALSAIFSIEKLSRSPARFDQAQLLYWQKMAVQLLTEAALWQWLGVEIKNQVPADKQHLFAKVIKANIVFPHDASVWVKIFFQDHIDYDPDALIILRETDKQFFVEAELAIAQHGVNLDAVLEHLKTTLGVSGKKLFQPLRIALTGKLHGPELKEIAQLLGQTKMQQRLRGLINGEHL